MVNFSLTLVGFGNIDRVLQPMFTSKKTAEDLNVTEIKPSSVAYRSFTTDSSRNKSFRCISKLSRSSLRINSGKHAEKFGLSDVVTDIILGGF